MENLQKNQMKRIWNVSKWNGNDDDDDVDTISFILKCFAAKDIAVAVCGQATIKPQSNTSLEFALSWDMPSIQFHKKIKQHKR